MRLTTIVPALVLALAACGSGGGDPAVAPSSALPTSVAPTSATPTLSVPTVAASAGPGHAKLVFSGAFSMTVDRTGAFCAYYYPSMRKGVAYSVRSQEGEAQRWDFTASDDEGTGRAVAYLNVSGPGEGSYAGDARNGAITLSLDRTKATFDFDVLRVPGRQAVHVKGTITCPAS